jgi:biopolymer transport protein ExbD
MQDLSSLLSLDSEKLNEYMATRGIPTDSVNGKMSEFQDWITVARDNNGPDMKIAIKADASTPYKTIKKMMSELQDMSENRYYLITALKSNSED